LAKQSREIEYIDVISDPENMKKMLEYSGGSRKVPVIVDQGKISIGFNGRS